MWRSLLACGLAVIAPVASAQVFECTSAAGVKQYAQFCPPGTVQQRQVTKGAESTSGAGAVIPGAGPKSIELQDAEYRQRMLERKDAETKAGQEQARAEEAERNCEEARAGLQAAQDGQRLQRFDPETGERIPYSDDDRAAMIERQTKAVAQWCK